MTGLLALGKEIKSHDEAFYIVSEDVDSLRDKMSPLSVEMNEI